MSSAVLRRKFVEGARRGALITRGRRAVVVEDDRDRLWAVLRAIGWANKRFDVQDTIANACSACGLASESELLVHRLEADPASFDYACRFVRGEWLDLRGVWKAALSGATQSGSSSQPQPAAYERVNDNLATLLQLREQDVALAADLIQVGNQYWEHERNRRRFSALVLSRSGVASYSYTSSPGALEGDAAARVRWRSRARGRDAWMRLFVEVVSSHALFVDAASSPLTPNSLFTLAFNFKAAASPLHELDIYLYAVDELPATEREAIGALTRGDLFEPETPTRAELPQAVRAGMRACAARAEDDEKEDPV